MSEDIKRNNKLFTEPVVRIVAALLVLYVLEMASYFFVAAWAGQGVGVEGTWNLKLPIDDVIPWVSALYGYYIIWPLSWFFVVPLLIAASCGEKGFKHYVVNGLLMYVIGSIIYVVFPTTTTEMDFVNGTIQQLDQNAPFYADIYALADSSMNIWGSFPSYHNYWAALLVLIPLFRRAKLRWTIPLVVLGLAITVSTLTLHQHCVMDVVLTYALTALFYFVATRLRWCKD